MIKDCNSLITHIIADAFNDQVRLDGMPKAELDEITDFVWTRHLAHKHKHEAPQVIQLRQLCD